MMGEKMKINTHILCFYIYIFQIIYILWFIDQN